MSTPAIAILWKGPGGTSCVVRRQGAVLVLTLERNGVVEEQRIIDSPREAMDLAAEWKASLEQP